MLPVQIVKHQRAQQVESLSNYYTALYAPALALEIVRCQRLVKGYGDTQVRGRQNYARLWTQHVAPALAGQIDVAAAADQLKAALKATLADPEGRLNSLHAKTAVPTTQPVFWAPRGQRENTITPVP